MKNLKAKLLAGAGVAAVIGLALVPFANAQLTSSTLGTSIDSINSTWYDYFTVLLNKFWPFLVGAGILVAVWWFGRHLLRAFH